MAAKPTATKSSREQTSKGRPMPAPATAPAARSTSVAAGAVTPAISREESTPMTPKNFRNHPDMENFFRFIYENDLRLEALQIIDEIIVQRQARRRKPSASANA